MVRATGELVQGHLSQAAAHLAVAKSHAETTTPDRQRRLRMATASVQAREISRPYLEVGCLAELGSWSEPYSFETARRYCHEAIVLAERHGWGAEPVIAPALITLADTINTHIRSIYAKLGADDRSGAVRRARELRPILRRGSAVRGR